MEAERIELARQEEERRLRELEERRQRELEAIRKREEAERRKREKQEELRARHSTSHLNLAPFRYLLGCKCNHTLA